MNATDEHQALLAAVLDQPAEDTARLVFADWLQENGDDARANVIRWMVNHPSWFAGATCLEDSDSSPGYLQALDWFKNGACNAELSRIVDGAWAYVEGRWVWYRGLLVAQDFMVQYVRGFVESVECPTEDWFAHGPALMAAHPIAEVRLLGFRVDVLSPSAGRGWRTEYCYGPDSNGIATAGSWDAATRGEMIDQLMRDVRDLNREIA